MPETPLILLIHEDNQARTHTLRILMRAGYRTCCADDGQSGLRIASEMVPALALVSAHLPDLSGIEVSRQIKAAPALAGCLVILLTGRRSYPPILMDEMLDWVDGYITTPTHNAELMTKIRAMLRMRQTETALRESETRLREVLENSLDVAYKRNLKTNQYEYLSPVFARISGYTPDEMQMMPIDTVLSIIHAQDKEVVDREITRAISAAAGTSHWVEYRFKHKDGHYLWFHDQFTIIKDEDGQPQAMIGSVSDVTERKKADEALKLSEERYRFLFENAIEGIIQTTPDGQYLNANQSYVRMLGYDSAEEMIQSVKNLGSQIYAYSEDRARLLGLLSLNDRVENFECEVIRKDGQKIWISMNVNAVRGQKGDLIRIDSRLMNITSRKQAENSLRANEERLHLATLSGNIGIWDWEIAKDKLTWDDSMYALFGIRKEDFGGPFEAWLKILHPDDLELTRAQMLAAVRGEQDFNGEFRIVRPDGTIRYIRADSQTYRDLNGAGLRMIGTDIDITERRQTEEQLLLANEKLIVMVSTLEQRNHEANLLHEMDDLLQACYEAEEAYMAVQKFGPLLFPGTSGALFPFMNSSGTVEAGAIWGNHLQSQSSFYSNDCWVIRRGKPHYWSSLSPGLSCAHIDSSLIGDYLEIPLLAASSLLGVLHIESPDHRLNDPGITEVAQTITDRLALTLTNIQLREKLRAEAIRDPLTNLFNRRFMEEYLKKELNRASRKQSTVGVIMLDIDHFKKFNDSYGHPGGDQVLRELSKLLQTKIRGGDIACRYGGEEFLLILPETSFELIRDRAEQIKVAVQELKVEYHQETLGAVTVSVGVAMYPDHGANSLVIVSMADKALYNAKRKGRNRVEIAE